MILIRAFWVDPANAQIITYDDFKSLIPYVQQEDYKEAFQRSAKALSGTQNDSSDLRGIVTYLNIYSAAGMVTMHQMSYPGFQKNAGKFIGQLLVMAAHPCVDSSANANNSLKFITRNGRLQGMVISGNRNGTSILLFEYFDFEEPINSKEFVGKNIRTGGILESVEINPNQSGIWVARIHIRHAFARETSPR